MNKKYCRHVVLFFSSFFFLVGCASLSEQGKEALAAGEYERALSLYELALKNNKNNPEAKEGLRQARQAWIERKLIDVRLLRLADNFGDSEKLLRQLIQNQNEWQVFPVQAAFSTQTEEMNYFANRIRERIRKFLDQRNPLAAHIELNENRFLLEKALSENLSRVENTIYESGKNSVLKLIVL